MEHKAHAMQVNHKGKIIKFFLVELNLGFSEVVFSDTTKDGFIHLPIFKI
jgi:hypothetical protein